MIVKWLIIIYNLQKKLYLYTINTLTTFLGWRIHTREKTDLYSLTEKAILLLVIF